MVEQGETGVMATKLRKRGAGGGMVEAGTPQAKAKNKEQE